MACGAQSPGAACWGQVGPTKEYPMQLPLYARRALAGLTFLAATALGLTSGPAWATTAIPPVVGSIESTVVAGSPVSTLNTGSYSRSIVRSFDGRLHVVWGEPGTEAPRILYSVSADNGLTWSAPFTVRESTAIWQQPMVKIDATSRVHVFWAEVTPDYCRSLCRFVDADGTWSGAVALSAGMSDEIALNPNPGIDAIGNLSLVFDRSHYQGMGLKTWNGTTWSATAATTSYGADVFYANTIPDGANLHTFAYASVAQRLLNTNRISNVWTSMTTLTGFTVGSDHNEVFDSTGDIRMFVSDRLADSQVLSSVMDLPARTMGAWTVVDSEPGLDASQPSATVDHFGNTWVFYTLGDEICYRVYDQAAAEWTPRAYLTDAAIDGQASAPKVRYQRYGHAALGRIDLTYRTRTADGSYALRYCGLELQDGNIAPVSENDSYTLQVDGSLSVPTNGVLCNDRDANGDVMTVALVEGTLRGTLNLAVDGSFDYTPQTGWSGADQFAYTASDGEFVSEVATVTLLVQPHFAPVANPDFKTVPPGSTVEVMAPGVLANDVDPNAEDRLSAELTQAPSVGSLVLHPDGSYEYTPPAAYHGVVTFAYRASDGVLSSEDTSVTITFNTPPLANNDYFDMHQFGVLKLPAAWGMLSNELDEENDALTATVTKLPAHGTLNAQPSGAFTYAVNGDWLGTDTFEYTVSDGYSTSGPVTARIAIYSGAAADGYVYDAVTGEPLAGIVVRGASAWGDDISGDRGAVTAVTDATGHYRLSGLIDDDFSCVSFIDRSDVYRDEHLWSQTVPVEASTPGYFQALTTGVDAYLMPVAAAKSNRVTRVSGTDRYTTAIKSSQFWQSCETVVLASGAGYADALSAAPLAGSYNAPILLTPPAEVPSTVLAEISRLKTSKVIIVGGLSAVSENAEKNLKDRGLSVVRLSGADRYATCLAITRHLIWREGDNLSPEPFVVRGDNYADALAVAPFAWNQVRPILLVRPTSAPPAIVTGFRELQTDAIVIVGGESAVGQKPMYDLWYGALYPEGIDLTYWRIAGKNRYDTAAKVGRFWGDHYDRYAIASGQGFPDALAGGPLMGALRGAMLLTAPASLSPEAGAMLTADAPYIGYALVLGGDKAVAPAAFNSAVAKIGTQIYDMNFYTKVGTAYGSESSWSSVASAASASTQGPVSPQFDFVELGARERTVDIKAAPETFRPAD